MAEPVTRSELNFALAQFRRRNVDTLIIDGGDGTVRDVLSMMPAHFGNEAPKLLVVPSGKTNALAHDLGIAANFDLLDALTFMSRMRTIRRSPIDIRYRDERHRDLRGFLFGAGAFVKATVLAQRFHHIGAFRGMAVGGALTAALYQSIFARDGNPWRQGEEMAVGPGDVSNSPDRRYIFLASTLQRLPPGIMPFGTGAAGMRILDVSAPPRRLAVAVPILLTGRYPRQLEKWGYRQRGAETVRLKLASDFVLDGEAFPGGDLSISLGPPIDFLVPD